jgi:hypothetical protein
MPSILPFVSLLQARWNNMRDHMDIAVLSSTYEMVRPPYYHSVVVIHN